MLASATLVAARKVETARRSDAKKKQEETVRVVLRNIGYEEVGPRDVSTLDSAPGPGKFCGESKLGDTRADLVIRLHDRRAMALECKVSNSAVNSFKRIKHEAAGKARSRLSGFGHRQIVPAAVIGGVFNPVNLEMAQAEGLAIFRSHCLSESDGLHRIDPGRLRIRAGVAPRRPCRRAPGPTVVRPTDSARDPTAHMPRTRTGD